MKRKIVALCAVVVMALSSVAGCGGKSASTTEEPEKQTGTKAEEVRKPEGDGSDHASDFTFHPIDKSTKGTLTKEEIQEPRELDKEIAKLDLGSTTSTEDRVDAAYDAVQKIADNGELSIKDVNKGDNCLLIEFQSGVLYYLSLADSGTNDGDTPMTVTTVQPYYTTGNYGFDENGEIIDHIINDPDMDNAAQQIAGSAGNTSFNSNIDDNISYADLPNIFTKNSIVIWDGHGGYYNKDGVNIGFVLPLGENTYSAVDTDPYLNALYQNGHAIYTSGDRLCLTAEMVVDLGYDLSNSAFFFTNCHTMQDERFGQALKDQGAAVSFGFTDEVGTAFATKYMSTLLAQMCVADESTGEMTTLYDAMQYTKKTYAAKDPDYKGARGYYLGYKDFHFNKKQVVGNPDFAQYAGRQFQIVQVKFEENADGIYMLKSAAQSEGYKVLDEGVKIPDEGLPIAPDATISLVQSGGVVWGAEEGGDGEASLKLDMSDPVDFYSNIDSIISSAQIYWLEVGGGICARIPGGFDPTGNGRYQSNYVVDSSQVGFTITINENGAISALEELLAY